MESLFIKNIFIYEKSDRFPLNGGNWCGSTPEYALSYNNNNFYNSVRDIFWQDMTTVCSDELQKLKKEDPRYSGEL